MQQASDQSHDAVARRVGSRFGDEEARHHGDQRQRHQHRQHDGDRERDRERAEKAPGDARQQRQRHEHENRGERGADDGGEHVVITELDRLVPRVALFDARDDAFGDDDRVVDDEADRDRETTERHEVEGDAKPVHDGERREQRERHRQRGDEAGAQVADQDRVAHARQRLFDERGLVVDRL